MNIEEWRSRIDDIDRKLVNLLSDRTRCAIAIAKLKKHERLKVIDPVREQEVFRNIEDANDGPLDADSMIRIFRRIIEETRRIERIETGGE